MHDENLRKLERQTQLGDPNAALQLAATWQRVASGAFDGVKPAEIEVSVNHFLVLGTDNHLIKGLLKIRALNSIAIKVTGELNFGLGLSSIPLRIDGIYTHLLMDAGEDWYPYKEKADGSDVEPSLKVGAGDFRTWNDPWDHVFQLERQILRPIIRDFMKVHPEFADIGKHYDRKKRVLREMKELARLEEEYMRARNNVVQAVREYLGLEDE